MEIKYTTLFMAIAAAVVVLCVTVAILRKHHNATLYVGKRLMSDHEVAFAKKLTAAVESFGNYGIMAQVAMGAFIQPRAGLSNRDRQRTWNTVSQKIVDFVVIDAIGNVKAVIELDDKTHSIDKDRDRDSIVSRAGFKTVRFRNGFKITTRQIAERLEGIL